MTLCAVYLAARPSLCPSCLLSLTPWCFCFLACTGLRTEHYALSCGLERSGWTHYAMQHTLLSATSSGSDPATTDGLQQARRLEVSRLVCPAFGFSLHCGREASLLLVMCIACVLPGL
jgi:hypothetical protein